MAHVRGRLGYSERGVCRALGGIGRSTIRYVPTPRADEGPLRAAVVRLATQYGRYGYRRVAGEPEPDLCQAFAGSPDNC